MPSINRRVIPTGSTNGLPILLTTTSSPGNIIHTFTSDTTGNITDSLWFYAANEHTAALQISIELVLGGTTRTITSQSLPSKGGLYQVFPAPIAGNNGLIVRAFCATANVIQILAFVNRRDDTNA